MYINGALLTQMFKQGSHELKRNMEIINDLNVFPVPDGDTGTNMSLTMESAVENLSSLEELAIEKISKGISRGSLMGARGNSGVILSQIFRGFAKGCEKKEKLSAVDFADALKKASDSAYSAVMKPVEGTILTVIRKTSEKAVDFVDEETTIDEAMEYVIHIAEKTLEETPKYLEVLEQAGVVDAGGKGLVCILHGFQDAILGKEFLEEELKVIEGQKEELDVKAPEDIRYAYCTEFIIEGKAMDAEELKKRVQKLGDSMVFVSNDDIIKVHVHTNNPGIALEYALECGELIKVKIDNMRKQHEETLVKGPAEEEVSAEELKKYELIAVALGDGVVDIFEDLGVTKIISGGQTMNPSTQDLLEKIDESSAEEIIILPNNSNIILAAQQAKEISDKNVHILPTKSIVQGISSLIEFDWDAEVEENLESMSEIIEDIKTIEVTYSVKDTTFNDQEIKEGQYLGVSNKKISSVGHNLHDVTLETIKKNIDEYSEIVTIYYGEEAEEEAANQLAAEVEELLDFGEVEVYYGGQPLYYYLISIE